MPPETPNLQPAQGETTKRPATKRPISDAALRAAKPAEKSYKIAAGGGLYLEVTPTGSKLWRWKYRLHGKENRFAIGRYPEIPLKEAREAAEAARKQVKEGQHPAQQKQINRLLAARDQKNTFEAIAREWVEGRDWEEVTKKRRLNMLERVVFPHIGKFPAKQIVSEQILHILNQAAENNGISVANEAKRTTASVFGLAIATLRAKHDPVHPVRDALPKNKTQHKRPLTTEEIGQLLRDVDGHGGYHQIQGAFNLMWLTLARPSEAIEAEWSEIDLDAALWRIPAERMKKRKEHLVPLPHQAVALLRGMHTLSGTKKHVFPHRDDKTKPMVTASFRQMLNVLGWAGIFSPHATRTTGSTHLNEMGYSPDWIERQLAHEEPNAVRRTYNHADYLKDRTEMMQCWANLLDQWKKGNKSEEAENV